MPIYEYRCGACGQRVEVLVRSSAAVPRCPDCGEILTDKLFSVPYVVSRETRPPEGNACCGQEEECDRLPCFGGDGCRHN